MTTGKQPVRSSTGVVRLMVFRLLYLLALKFAVAGLFTSGVVQCMHIYIASNPPHPHNKNTLKAGTDWNTTWPVFCCIIVIPHVHYCANSLTHFDLCTLYTTWCHFCTFLAWWTWLQHHQNVAIKILNNFEQTTTGKPSALACTGTGSVIGWWPSAS